MTPSLDVYLYGRRVAQVRDAGVGEGALAYTAEGVAAGPAATLSLALPPRPEPYAARHGGNRWMRAVLPERELRTPIAERFRIDPDDDLRLLSVLGRDVAGAAVIVPEGEPPEAPDARAELIGEGELARRLADLPRNPLGVDPQAGVRLSLAGQQHKLLLTRLGGQWARPLDGEPSTVIVKPEPASYPALPTNELFGLRLASAVGFVTAEASLLHVEGVTALAVERYDRVTLPGGGTARVHQEDVLGALGFDPTLKYEFADNLRKTGPGLTEIGDLLAGHLGRAALVRLAEIVAFNAILGNADAHARNLSLLLMPDGTLQPAPLYDLVCTLVYPDLTTQLPQRVGPAESMDEVNAQALAEQFAPMLPSRLTLQRAQRVARAIDARMDAVAQKIVAEGGDEDALGEVAALVRSRLPAFSA